MPPKKNFGVEKNPKLNGRGSFLNGAHLIRLIRIKDTKSYPNMVFILVITNVLKENFNFPHIFRFRVLRTGLLRHIFRFYTIIFVDLPKILFDHQEKYLIKQQKK